MRRYIIYAGVNGAGKSTLFNSSNEWSGMPYVNMDEIVRSFGNWNNPEDALRGGKEAVRRVKSFLCDGVSFSQETTLCGKSILRNIRKAKELGYSVEIFFVSLESPELAKERIAYRVKAGGHGVSDEDVERRYFQSIENLIYVLPICDRVDIYDNTRRFRLIAQIEHGECVALFEPVPSWCKGILDSCKNSYTKP